MIANIRVASHQLKKPVFNSPKELVSWMGAVQAQEYTMAKWALGIRLKSPSLNAVETALQKGEIIRTHIMRPTWHFVASEDLRWMLKLSADRIKAAYKSYIKSSGGYIDETEFAKCDRLLERILEGHKNLTRQEIAQELIHHKISVNDNYVNGLIAHAEAGGIICSGMDKGKKTTYALVEERIPPARELHKEEALALLASRYFKSHSPALLQDFIWWSGLTASEAKLAINLIDSELLRDKFESQKFLVHQSWGKVSKTKPSLHFLPSYDEYLISYKDRTPVLPLEHYSKAFNNWGIFYPVILYQGQVVGNWQKVTKKGECVIEKSFFDENFSVDPELIRQAEERLKSFLFG